MCFMCFGCSGEFDSKTIEWRDYFEQDRLVIPLKIKKAFQNGDCLFFNREESLRELADFINKMSGENLTYSAVVGEKNIFITKKSDKTSYYYIKELEDEDNPRKYALGNMSARLYRENDFNGLLEDEDIIFPYHYSPIYEGSSFTGGEMNYFIKENTNVLTGGTFDEIFAFYDNLKKFTLSTDIENQTITFNSIFD